MFSPWVGDNYGNADNLLAGTRLMILGESHYTHEPEKVGTNTPTFTSWVVREQALTKRSQFFNKLAAITLNRPRSSIDLEDAARFWHSVVFYNYVPVMVDGRPGSAGGNNRRPTEPMFAAGAEPLKTILRKHEPQAVLVCGLELWSWVAPGLNGFDGPPRDVIYYDDGGAVFARIRHPSSPQFREKEWPARVHGLIERSVQPRMLGQKTLWQPE